MVRLSPMSIADEMREAYCIERLTKRTQTALQVSRRSENTTDTLSREPHPQVVPIEGNRKGNGAPDALNA